MLQKPGISGCRETGPGQARQSGEMLAGLESQEAVRRGENRSFSFLILANSHASIPRGGDVRNLFGSQTRGMLRALLGRTPESEGRIMSENEKAIVAAQKVLDEFMEAFNARDVEAFEATFNFPSVRLASGKLILIDKGFHTPSMFTTGALADWDHSAWERRNVLHVGPDKVHIDTRFSRYRKDGSVIGGFDSIYVVTSENGHWGVKIRSSFAP